MPDMVIIVADCVSEDRRDGGAYTSQDLYQVEKKKEGEALCAYLNGLAILARSVYSDWGNDRTFKTREDSYKASLVYEDKIRRWFSTYSVAYNYRFKVDVRPILPIVDLTPLKKELAA